MARKPDIKGDRDNWGDVLNEYLGVSLDEDGTIKEGAITNEVAAALPISDATQSALDGKIAVIDGVFGVGVRRIIASTDPDYPLENGDLLVLIEDVRAFSDFSEYSTGQGPDGWTMPWVASTWTIETDAEASGGKVLRVVNGSQGRRALAWASLDDAAQYADVEIVYKWRTSATDGAVRAFCRGSGAQGSETAYYAGYQTAGNQANISKVVAGANTGMTFPAAPAIATNTWYISRFRVAGSVLSFRTWAATSAEPGTWNGTATDTDITDAGLVGLLPFGVATTEFDWVGVAFGGETAPMEAI